MIGTADVQTTIETRRLAGAPVVAALRAEIAGLLTDLPGTSEAKVTIATVAVGLDDAASAYRGSIVRTCLKVGLAHRGIDLAADAGLASLVRTIQELNLDPNVTGILVFMPLPAHLPRAAVLEALSPAKDIDGITPTSQGRLKLGLPALQPSCPLGGIELLSNHGFRFAGASAVVVGRSPVVGGPLATMLTARDVTVTVTHRHTRDLAGLTRRVDLVALAAGSPGLLRIGMVDPAATVIDFGTSMVDGVMRGDADHDGLAGHVAALSPVPGGTGPVTAYTLARNACYAKVAQLAGDLDAVPDPARCRSRLASSPIE